MSMLTVEQLTKKYQDTAVVDAVSFALQEKTSTALIGPNGAGKTTTLSMLTGLLAPTSGKISLSGIQGDPRRFIGFLPQYPQFFNWMTAMEYMEMAARLSGVEAKPVRMEAQKTLEFVGLGDALKKKTGTFSGGMRQRLGLAQAIVHKPKLLLLDEPVSALDPVGRREIMNLLKDLQSETTILYSTHILNDAEEMTDQLLFLRKGKLVEQGSLADVRAKYENRRYRIEFSSSEAADTFVSNNPWAAVNEGPIVFVPREEDTPKMEDVLRTLANSGLEIRKVERQTASLEEIFMKVVGRV